MVNQPAPDWELEQPGPCDVAPVVRWDGGVARAINDTVVCEEPLEIRVRGRGVSVTMRTPGHDDELAVGFLAGEGVVRGPADVLRVTPCARNELGNVIDVTLAAEAPLDLAALTRHVFASSSCGLCGKATIEAVRGRFAPVTSDVRFDPEAIARMPEQMRRAQATFDRTGGLHAAALFDEAGELVVLREDVGRHNAVDKVVGHCILSGRFPLDRCLLLVSGRSSFEIMQKALAARIPVVAAVSAPSGLATRFAAESGQTLIGFLRGRRMNVYAHPWRVVGLGDVGEPEP